MLELVLVSNRRDPARSGPNGSMSRAMRRLRERSRRAAEGSRAVGDRGAVLVEAALMLPILFAVVVGIIDFGNSFNDWISVRQGARDGMRQVIVKTNPTYTACPTGSVTGAGAGAADVTAIICYTKNRVGLDATKTAVRITMTGTSFTAGQPVKICVAYRTSSLSRFYANILDNHVVDTEVESLIEQTSAGLAGTAYENTWADGFPGTVPWSTSCQSA